MLSMINTNSTASLFFKLGLDQDLNDLSNEGNLFTADRIRPLITASAYKAEHLLNNIGFPFENAALTASAITGSLTGSELTFIQYTAQELQENIFNESFYIAYGTKIGHAGLEEGSFDHNKQLIDFHRRIRKGKLVKVGNLLSASRGESPESYPGLFHVVGGE